MGFRIHTWAAIGAAVAVGALAPLAAQSKSSGTCARVEREQLLTSTGADANASARARLRQRDDCRRDFSVEIEDVDAGDYELVVNDVVRGTIAARPTASGVEGEIELEAADNQPHPLTLDFDPLGAVIEIRRAGVVYFADVFGAAAPPASPSATPTGTPSRLQDRTRTRTATIARTATPARTGTPPRTATRARTVTPTRVR